MNILETKSNLILKIIKNQIKIGNKSNEEIQCQLHEQGFQEKETFDLLINLPLKMMTREYYTKLLQEIKCIQEDLINLKNLQPKELWKNELKELERFYT